MKAGTTFNAGRLIDLYYASEELGPWMSAALDDEHSCEQFKAAIQYFLQALGSARGSKEEGTCEDDARRKDG